MSTQLTSKLLKNILKSKFENTKFSVTTNHCLTSECFKIKWVNSSLLKMFMI